MIYGRRDGRWLGHLGFCADNLSDVSGFTTSYSFEIVSLVIRPGTMRSEDKDENGTISTKHNSSLVIPSVIVMTMRRFLHAHMVVDTVSYMVADVEAETPVADFFLRISAKILSISKNFCQNFCQNSAPKSM